METTNVTIDPQFSITVHTDAAAPWTTRITVHNAHHSAKIARLHPSVAQALVENPERVRALSSQDCQDLLTMARLGEQQKIMPELIAASQANLVDYVLGIES